MLKKLLVALPVVLLVGAGGAYWYANAQAKSIVDQRLADMVATGGYDAATYEELNVGWNGGITMKNLNLVQGPMDYTLQDITVTNFDYTNEFPRHMDITVSGVQVAVSDAFGADPEAAQFAAMMASLGFDAEIPLFVNYTHRYDPDNAHQTDSSIHMAVPESFTLDATSVTRGVPMSAFYEMGESDPVLAQQQVLALVADAEFASMQMSLRDQGFLDSIMATSAAQNGVAPEDFRNMLVSQARNLYLFLPPTAQDVAMATGNEVAEFLEGGKTLSISIAPEYGGKLQRLQEEVMGAMFTGDYNKISELLHLEISAD